MRRVALLTMAVLCGCGPTAAGRRPVSDEQAARDLRRRAEAFLRDELPTVAPQGTVETSALRFHCLAGDLFKAGHSVAVVAFIDREKTEYGELLLSPGAAFFSHQSGRWELRACLDAGCQPMPDGQAVEMEDLSGDGVPEVLLIGSWGFTGNRCEAVYKYDKRTDSLVCVVEELGRPHWDGKQVLSWWRNGCAGLDNVTEGHAWVGDRLVRRWRATQEFLNRKLVGSGESAVVLSYTEFDAAGKEAHSWHAVGNLLSYRNGVMGGEGAWEGKVVLVDVRMGDRRRLVRIEPRGEQVRALGLEDEFPAEVSRAVFERPGDFSPETELRMPNSRSVRISDVAKVEVDNAPRTVTAYECFCRRGDWLKEIGNAPKPGFVVASERLPQDLEWTLAWRRVFDRGASAEPQLFGTETAVCLYVRGPAFRLRGYADAGSGFVVRSARFEGETILVDCEIRSPGPDKTAEERTVHPVIMLDLGYLAPGSYRANVTVAGLGSEQSFKTGFKVAAVKP